MELAKLNRLDQKQFLYELKDYLIPYQDNIGIADKYSFGIEIEFVGSKHNDIERNVKSNFNKNWILVHDRSLNEEDEIKLPQNIYGGEIVSRKLYDETTTWDELIRLCDMLKNSGSYTDQRCGGHIHIGSQILKNKKSLKRFLKLWTVFEDVIYRFGYGEDSSYRDNMRVYASSFSNILKDFLESEDKVTIYNLNKFVEFYKIYGLSLEKTYALGKELPGNTIEIRCPNGTLNEIIWQNNINFFVKLLLRCNEKGNWDIIKKYLRDYNPKDYDLDEYNKLNIQKALILSDFIFDEDEDKKNFMKQYIKGSKNQKITH